MGVNNVCEYETGMRLGLCFAAIVVLMLVIAIVSGVKTHAINESLTLVVSGRYPKTVAANEG